MISKTAKAQAIELTNSQISDAKELLDQQFGDSFAVFEPQMIISMAQILAINYNSIALVRAAKTSS